LQPIGDFGMGEGDKSDHSLGRPGFSSEESVPGAEDSPSESQKESEEEMEIVRTSKQHCTQRPAAITALEVRDIVAHLARFHGCLPATIRRKLLAGETIETNLGAYHATGISDIPAKSVPTGLDADSEN
jgi:hypothetical protein